MVQEPPTSSKSSQNLSTVQATSWGSCLDICLFQLLVLQGNTITLAYKVGDHHEDHYHSEVLLTEQGKKKGDHDFGFFDYFLLVHLVFHFQLSYWN